jgi:hypothetical protein
MSESDPNRTWRCGHSRNGIYGMSTGNWIGLIHLEAGELDHLAPFLGLLGDELGEVGG